ncbi:hypothetical protein A2X44_00695 [candidate division CPR3 bacterium GWF2_35_18]|uniref:ribose-phosphate diphosphokinase n=1 Tax=candidate division CPR3 bacterium GW2011_GWF2_35_18 TaxID=1618350 RepID=A0A0G0ES97_UNCC3|nr:MAG: Ribose-phosphate pyrophosphokinase [candidate division CPR3 bacterium GW2011_GWF2_35_18]KKP86328.1 MAG: Ribose-phosphate pyrophosphokinase [candidate division CPR3 bacterium GW2011_GWE2_35_7]OGB63428.1 MAG: hypothetical protein A2X44_00695 [candidate division CPR3 bacterium GWF2_35_18]OGB64827.1 MAG: hypothetical protein A2250_05335 [candidate division CPR3 bacterium RIFOXYA2_FULL_35_13]OGB76944.1 MAG: hypothetical protein A2476_05155 [candidate division CPR3 bacterium RIFOXYC2_FULL_35_
MQHNFSLVTGNSHSVLNTEIEKLLHIFHVQVELTRFANSEIRVYVQDTDVKDKNVVFVLQTLSKPVNDNLMELCLIADALKRIGVKKIVAVTPWLCYSPQDKIFRKGEPLSIALVAKLIESAGIDELWAFDIHSEEVIKTFNIPINNLSAMSLFIEYFQKQNLQGMVVACLDKGAEERAIQFASELKLPLIKFDKSRDRKTGEVTFHHLTGEFKGKHIVSFDDFASTGTTRIKAAQLLKNFGALSYTDCITHLFPIPETYQKLADSEIDSLFITNTIPILEQFKSPKMRVFSVASIIANKISEYLDKDQKD